MSNTVSSNRQGNPWWAGETAVRISDVPRHVPKLPDGRQVSIASAYRWTKDGLHGVKLRRFRVGGCWCTTTQELARWSMALTTAFPSE
jgi:hypothetical protein